MQARMSPPLLAVSKTAESDVSCVQRYNFWPAVHDTPTVVAQNQGVLPEGKTRFGDAYVP